MEKIITWILLGAIAGAGIVFMFFSKTITNVIVRERIEEKEVEVSIIKEQKDCESVGGNFNIFDSNDSSIYFPLGGKPNYRYEISCIKNIPSEKIFDYKIKESVNKE